MATTRAEKVSRLNKIHCLVLDVLPTPDELIAVATNGTDLICLLHLASGLRPASGKVYKQTCRSASSKPSCKDLERELGATAVTQPK